MAASLEEIEASLESELVDRPVGQKGRAFLPLSLDEIKAAIASEISTSHGSLMADSTASEERRQALRAFYGEPLGNEVEGRSKVVMTEVADTIHWIMPSLIRMFVGAKEIWEFEPTAPGTEEQAEQASEYLNHLFFEEMDGFRILFDFMFTALLEKNGYVIVETEQRIEPRRKSFNQVSPEQLQMLLNEYGMDSVVEFSEMDAIRDGQQTKVSDVTFIDTKRSNRIVCRGIPPEEFLIARRTVRLDDDAVFVAERRKMTAGDLVALGFSKEVVENLPEDMGPEFAEERIVRMREDEVYPMSAANRPDGASREVWVNNVYIRIDEDGDGFAECRHIICVGDQATEVLYDDYADYPPFAALTASPIPHKFLGQSIYDLIGDLQEIRTVLMRQILDNLYLTNNSRLAVVEDQVELDDLLTNRPGGFVRMQSPDAVTPIITPPLPPIAMNMMEFLDQVRETRVGVSKFTQGVDASSLGSSASSANAMISAGMQRIELIGKIFAEGGLKRLGTLLLREFKKNRYEKEVVRMRGRWVEIDPASWDETMNVKVKTGLGVGASQERIGYLMATLQLQKELLGQGASFMVSPKDVYRTVKELNKAMGFSAQETFFTNPEGQDWPQPPPDHRLLENERRVKDDTAKNILTASEKEREERERQDLKEYRMKDLQLRWEQAQLEAKTRKEIAAMQLEAAEAKGEQTRTGGEMTETDD
jgi:hypothetical protein